mmetsp:Transcript_10124/g.21711  ORF Transcript_10124/g.21711 Transcript_10124/m.21711 type:complete len:212 (+) Transcript_10124:432-1067(+)
MIDGASAVPVIRKTSVVVGCGSADARSRKDLPRRRMDGALFDFSENVSHDFLLPRFALCWILFDVGVEFPRRGDDVVARHDVVVVAVVVAARHVLGDQTQLRPRPHVIDVKIGIVILRQRGQIALLDLGDVRATGQPEGQMAVLQEGQIPVAVGTVGNVIAVGGGGGGRRLHLGGGRLTKGPAGRGAGHGTSGIGGGAAADSTTARQHSRH